MFKHFGKKKMLFLSTALGVLGCFVAAISTFAWLQLDQQPIQSSLVSSSPNLTVDNNNVYGYKISHSIGDNGFIDYSSEDVAKFEGKGITGTNHHQDDSDTNFNVPENGIGYYLVKKNPGGTFKYKYSADGSTYTSYNTKFTEYTSTYISRAYIGSLTIAANDEFRVMHYTFADSKTVNVQVKISTVYGGGSSVDEKTCDVKVATAGTYKVWLDYNALDLSFEPVAINSGGISIRSSGKKTENESYSLPTRAAGSGTTSANNIYLYLNDQTNNYNDNWFSKSSDPWVQIWGVSVSSDFAYYNSNGLTALKNAYDAGVTSWNQMGDSSSNIEFGYENTTLVNVSIKMVYVSSDTNNKNWKWDAPWFITGFSYKYKNSNGEFVGKQYNNMTSPATTNDQVTGWTWRNADGAFTYSKTSSSHTITTTTYTIAFDKNGASSSNPSDQTVKIYGKISQPSNPTKADCTFLHWSSGGSTGSAYSFGSAVTSYFTLTAVYQGTVALYASYFINGSQSSFTEEMTSTTKVCGTAYTASGYTGNRDYNDTTNAIHYTFARVNSSTWYTSAACSSTYTNGSNITKNTNIYAKFNCAFTNNYTTFYVEIKDANTNGSSQWTGLSVMLTNGSAKTIDCIKVASTLYRVTLPNAYEFRLGNGYTSGSPDGTQNFTSQVLSAHGNLPSSHVGSILYVQSTNSATYRHDFQWCAVASTATYGTATIKVSSDGSTWKDPVTNSTSVFTTTMHYGDGSSNNYFVYEHGLQISSGMYIDVVVSGSSAISNTNYGQLSNDKYYNPGDRPYLSTSGTYLQTANYSGTARFNFYITGSGQLSIAMVPDLGNGYYIMPYNNTYGTNNYIGSIKMTTNSDFKATYEGFYAAAGSEYYIRSYIDAVDKLMTSQTSLAAGVYLGTTNGSTPTAAGVLHFTNANYYNITVENGSITVSAYDVDTSFKLNKLDTSKVTYARDIWSQKTSIVLSVPFTSANTYSSGISLTVSNTLSHFVGVSLYVVKPFSTTTAYAIGDACIYDSNLYVFKAAHSAGAWNNNHVTQTDPYHFMRGTDIDARSTYYNALSNAGTITDQANASVSSSDGTCYAYILVDYLPTTVGGPSGDSLNGVTTNCKTSSTTIYTNTEFISTNLSYSLTFYLNAEQE